MLFRVQIRAFYIPSTQGKSASTDKVRLNYLLKES